MKILSQTKVNELWKSPKNKAEINKGAEHNIRQSFHAKLSQKDVESGPYLRTFLSGVRSELANAAKFKKFKSILSFPLPSNLLISKGADEWNKVFYAQDRKIAYDFMDEKYREDFINYLKDHSFESLIDQVLFTKVKQSLNTVAVVDMPQLAEGGSSMSEPYVYFKDISELKDVDVNATGDILYVMFETGQYKDNDRQLVVIDGTSYRVYNIQNVGQQLNMPVVESIHNLGYCPACFIWRDSIDANNSICRFNTVSESLDDMDRLVKWSVYSQDTDLYAAFPIMYEWGTECDDEECETPPVGIDNPNRDRKIVDESADKFGVGPGHLVKVTIPEGDTVRFQAPVGFVQAEPNLLVYVKERIIRQTEIKIIKHLTGVDNEIQNEKAFNESQIRSQYETRHSVLRYWAENVQYIHKFLIDTLAKARYGELFLGSTVDYGMDYFLYDAKTAQLAYEQAKESGAPEYVIAKLRSIMEQAITRSSPSDKARFDILAQIEPYIDRKLEEIDNLSPQWELKANFSHYISRFEREYGNIINFGIYLDINTKISIINSTLYEYVKEQRKFTEENSKVDRLRQPGQETATSSSGGVA